MRHLVVALAVFMLAACAHPDRAEIATGSVYRLYFLGGQSNMEGAGYARDLPAGVFEAAASVPIFHGKTPEDGRAGGGEGLWSVVRSGHGFGFGTDGRVNSYSDRFGPEISFAGTMALGAEKVAIIKVARGGTSLAHGVSGYGSWDPEYAEANGRNQLDYALTAIQNALAARDIDGDGVEDRLVPAGIVWMQGEADAAGNRASANDYARNLSRLMGILREALGDDELPVVIGRIKDSGDTEETRVMQFSPLVQEQQAQFAAQDRCAAIVDTTRGFSFPEDGWHYSSEDYLTLGTAFAEAMRLLEASC